VDNGVVETHHAVSVGQPPKSSGFFRNTLSIAAVVVAFVIVYLVYV